MSWHYRAHEIGKWLRSADSVLTALHHAREGTGIDRALAAAAAIGQIIELAVPEPTIDEVMTAEGYVRFRSPATQFVVDTFKQSALPFVVREIGENSVRVYMGGAFVVCDHGHDEAGAGPLVFRSSTTDIEALVRDEVWGLGSALLLSSAGSDQPFRFAPLGTPGDYIGEPTPAWCADRLKRRTTSNRTRSMLLVGPTGCIAADAEVIVNRGGKSKRMSLKRLVAKFNGSGGRGDHPWDLSVPTYVQSHADGRGRLGRVVQAVPSGRKTTWEIKTDTGRTVRATQDHPFLTPDGWRQLGQLSVGDRVLAIRPPQRQPRKAKPRYRQVGGLEHHPYACKFTSWHKRRGNRADRMERVARVGRHRLVAEAALSGLPYDDFVAKVRSGDTEGLVFLPPDLVVHHVNGDHADNSPSNLRTMTSAEHKELHAAQDGIANRVMWPAVPEVIVSIAYYGEEPTYDLTILDEHNFTANGFVVHNCGKTTLGRLTAVELAGADARTLKLSKRFLLEEDIALIAGIAGILRPTVLLLDDIQTLLYGHGDDNDLLEILEAVAGKTDVVVATLMEEWHAYRSDEYEHSTAAKVEAFEAGALHYEGLRPGRIDEVVRLDAPDKAGRARILAHYLGKPPSEEILAETVGLTGAYLRHLAETLKLFGEDAWLDEVRRIRVAAPRLPSKERPKKSTKRKVRRGVTHVQHH